MDESLGHIAQVPIHDACAERPGGHVPFLSRLVRTCAVAALAPLCCAASASNDRITLPLHLVNGVPVVQLRIHDKDIPFTLDTGASDALYLDADAERAIPEFARTGQRVKSMDIGGTVVEDEEITAHDLVVDGMHFLSVHGRTLTPWGLGHDGPAPPPRVSVLGLRFFDGKQVLFDVAASKVTVWDAAGAAAEGPSNVAAWRRVEYESAKEGLVVSMDGARAHYRLVLDSASTISLIRRASVAPEDGVPGCDVHFMPGAPCVSVAVKLGAGQPSLTLYEADLPERFHADGLLGRVFFDDYRVYLDTRQHLLRVDPVVAN